MDNLTISVITPKEESRIMRVSSEFADLVKHLATETGYTSPQITQMFSEFLEGKIKVGKN